MNYYIYFIFAAFTWVKSHIGWRYSMVVLGVLQSIIIGCGVLLRPLIIKNKTEDNFTQQLRSSQQDIMKSTPEAEFTGSLCSGDCGVKLLKEPVQSITVSRTPEIQQHKSKLLDLSVLKQGSFICYAAFGLFATLGFFAPQLFVVELSASMGTERDKAAYMLSIMAVAEIFGRLTIGWILSWACIRKIYILLGCLMLICLVLVLFTVVVGFWGLAVCCVLYGFLLGNIASTHIPMLAEDDVVGIERMPSAVGVYVCIQSFAGLAGPPLGGTEFL